MKFKVKDIEELIKVLKDVTNPIHFNFGCSYNIVTNYEGRSGADPRFISGMEHYIGSILDFKDHENPKHVDWFFKSKGFVWSVPLLVTNGKGEPVRFDMNRNNANEV